jgi:hypothetical protein
MRHSDVIKVPHLNLGQRFDVSKMVDEVAKIDRFEPYQSRKPLSKDVYSAVWSGVSLLSSDGEPYSDLHEVEDPITEFFFTPLAALCPYLCEVAKALNGLKARVRVMRLAPGGSLHWHSPHREGGQPKDMMTVYVPIITPAESFWSVMAAPDYDVWRNAGRPMPSELLRHHSVRYEPGSAWIFNSYHYHNVFNRSATEHQVSLLLYMNTKNPAVAKMVRAALAAHTGEPLADTDPAAESDV